MTPTTMDSHAKSRLADRDMRRVLIIVHDFPPCGGGGVMRTLKFVKYLPSFGWMPIVLTVDESYYDPAMVDNSWLRDIPVGVEIIRTPSLRPRRASLTEEGQFNAGVVGHAIWRLPRAIKRRLAGKLLVQQDDGFLWNLYARRAIRRLAKSRHIDIVFSSSPPHSVQLLGLLAKRALRKPWVADFRDGWVDDPLYRAEFGVRRTIDRSLERRVIQNADMVISATETIDEWFRERHRDLCPPKHAVITNGFDPEDFRHNATSDRGLDGAMRVVYAGALSSTRSGIPFLEALDVALARGEIPVGGIRVELCGKVDTDTQALASRIPGVTVDPLLPHEEAIAKMRSADVLLLVGSQRSPDALTGKLFEYIASRHPILALTPEGALAQLIARENIGEVAPVDDVDRIRLALVGLYTKHARGQLASCYRLNETLLASLDRRQQAQRLADIFDSLLAAR